MERLFSSIMFKPRKDPKLPIQHPGCLIFPRDLRFQITQGSWSTRSYKLIFRVWGFPWCFQLQTRPYQKISRAICFKITPKIRGNATACVQFTFREADRCVIHLHTKSTEVALTTVLQSHLFGNVHPGSGIDNHHLDITMNDTRQWCFGQSKDWFWSKAVRKQPWVVRKPFTSSRQRTCCIIMYFSQYKLEKKQQKTS